MMLGSGGLGGGWWSVCEVEGCGAGGGMGHFLAGEWKRRNPCERVFQKMILRNIFTKYQKERVFKNFKMDSQNTKYKMISKRKTETQRECHLNCVIKKITN